jgi:hypothetical protein
LNDNDADVDAIAGDGEFFRAHQICAPPHGQGPENVMAICTLVPVPSHAVWAKEFDAVMVPGAHFAVNTPAAAAVLLKMTGATHPTAPAPASFLSNLRRSSSVVSGGLTSAQL